MCTSSHRIVFEFESKKDTRNTRKRKTPFRFDREREKREKRGRERVLLVALQKNKTHRWIYERFVWYEP